jgi:hypothetical protein
MHADAVEAPANRYRTEGKALIPPSTKTRVLQGQQHIQLVPTLAARYFLLTRSLRSFLLYPLIIHAIL